MLVRFVKMEFQTEKLQAFLDHFEAHQNKIRHFQGCLYLEILQQGTTICSYSHWTDQAALDAYRQSPMFKNIWAYTKTLFAAPPQAWTFQRSHQLP